VGDERFIPHTADNGQAHRETWPLAWAGSIKTDDERLAEQVREAVRAAVQDPFGLQVNRHYSRAADGASRARR
jgi:hypothetical protein